MRVFRGLPPAADFPIALTIGNFDGVHRGHQAMLSRLVEAADDLALPSAVLTFDPPPREFFAKATAPARLSSGRDKVEQFAARGVARTYVARFDGRLAALEPEAFIDAVLVRRLGVRWLLVGEDFRFGRGRTGDLATLRRNARTFSVEAMRTVSIGGERASSTAVRAALAAGELARAGALLGAPLRSGAAVAQARPPSGIPDGEPAIATQAAGVEFLRCACMASAARRDRRRERGRAANRHGRGGPCGRAFLFGFDADLRTRIGVEFVHKLRRGALRDFGALARQIDWTSREPRILQRTCAVAR